MCAQFKTLGGGPVRGKRYLRKFFFLRIHALPMRWTRTRAVGLSESTADHSHDRRVIRRSLQLARLNINDGALRFCRKTLRQQDVIDA